MQQVPVGDLVWSWFWGFGGLTSLRTGSHKVKAIRSQGPPTQTTQGVHEVPPGDIQPREDGPDQQESKNRIMNPALGETAHTVRHRSYDRLHTQYQHHMYAVRSRVSYGCRVLDCHVRESR